MELKESLLMPKTDFEMRGNLAIKEPVLVEKWKNEKTHQEFLNYDEIQKYMDFGGLPTVDLVIRTKQKLAKRLSGFMLWRI